MSVCFAAAQPQPLTAGVDIRTRVHPETAAVGDLIRIGIEITAPRGFGIEIMEPEGATGDFHIFDFIPGPAGADAEESGGGVPSPDERAEASERHAARIVAAAYKTGTFTFPGVAVIVTDPGGRRTRTQSPPVDVEIRSVLAQGDTGLRDLKEQADIPGEIPWLPLVLAAATAALLGAATWYVRRKFRKTPSAAPSTPAEDPLLLAESQLWDLIARNLPENGRTKEFYVLLSEIVKRILEAAYGIATAERTTIEIMDSLRGRTGLGPQRQETIRSVLLECDLVKFAKYIPSKSENDRAAEEAGRILSQAREYIKAAGGSDKTDMEIKEAEQ
ncbi:MAG: hypothetical protein JW793_10895 [Acidobacteria bacterium]|nr:hypothetical protein [Acidobacteriota bacterium]